MFEFLELLQHLVHQIGVAVCSVDILARVVFNIKQARACLFCAFDWGTGWLTATNGSIFQHRSSGSLICSVESWRSIPSTPSCSCEMTIGQNFRITSEYVCHSTKNRLAIKLNTVNPAQALLEHQENSPRRKPLIAELPAVFD